MDMRLALLLLFVIVTFGLLVSPSFLSRMKRAEENNLTPLFQEWCAVQRNSGSGSSMGRNMFLWRVTLYPEFMVLALFSQDLIPYREVDRVGMKNFQNSQEVWLHRHVGQVGEFIAIKSRKAERMIEILAGLGVRSNPVPGRSNKRV